MKRKIRKLFEVMGNGLQAEYADEMMYSRRVSDALQVYRQEGPTPRKPAPKIESDNRVRLYVVPSLLQHK